MKRSNERAAAISHIVMGQAVELYRVILGITMCQQCWQVLQEGMYCRLWWRLQSGWVG